MGLLPGNKDRRMNVSRNKDLSLEGLNSPNWTWCECRIFALFGRKNSRVFSGVRVMHMILEEVDSGVFWWLSLRDFKRLHLRLALRVKEEPASGVLLKVDEEYEGDLFLRCLRRFDRRLW